MDFLIDFFFFLFLALESEISIAIGQVELSHFDHAEVRHCTQSSIRPSADLLISILMTTVAFATYHYQPITHVGSVEIRFHAKSHSPALSDSTWSTIAGPGHLIGHIRLQPEAAWS